MKSSLKDRRTQLERERQKIQRRVEHAQSDERQETANGQTDNAHEWENAELREDELTVAMRELREVDTALERIDQGTYGLCDVCGKPIAEKRLDALPCATHCVECAGR